MFSCIKSEPFMGVIKKRYETDCSFEISTIIDRLVEKGCIIRSINISEDCDIGCRMYLGSYSVEEFWKNENTFDDSNIEGYSIFLDDPDLESIHFSPKSTRINAYFKTPDKDLSDYLN